MRNSVTLLFTVVCLTGCGASMRTMDVSHVPSFTVQHDQCSTQGHTRQGHDRRAKGLRPVAEKGRKGSHPLASNPWTHRTSTWPGLSRFLARYLYVRRTSRHAPQPGRQAMGCCAGWRCTRQGLRTQDRDVSNRLWRAEGPTGSFQCRLGEEVAWRFRL